MKKNTPHFSMGSENDYAFVFSCPGRHEEAAGHPVAKQTGRNFEKFLQALNQITGKNSFHRNRVTITNSWDQIEYQGKTGRSEADLQEVLSTQNLNRLLDELAHVQEIIFCSGIRAEVAIGALKSSGQLQDVRILSMPHLGMRGINSIKTDLSGAAIIPAEKAVTLGIIEKKEKTTYSSDNTMKRLKVIAAKVMAENIDPLIP